MQTVRGSIYMAAATIVSHPVGLISMVFLARLLDPKDFGAVALAMVLFATARLFSDLGMSAAIVHSPRASKTIAFHGFVINATASLALFGLVNINPIAFANFLGNPQIVDILKVLSLFILLDSWATVPEALLRKEMRFERVSQSIAIGNILENICGVGLALLGFGVWSLVYGRLFGALVQLLIVWFACPGWDWLIPKRLNWTIMRELLVYGLYSTSGGFMNFFNSNWDDWLVGRVFGTALLGFYDKAYSITNGVIVNLNRQVVNSVLLPSYVRIQNDKDRLARAYLKGLTISTIFMAPLSMGVFAIAGELVAFVLGEKWIPMVPALEIFAFMALARPMAGTTSPLFRAMGRPDFDFRAGVFLTVVMAPMVFFLLGQGITGVAFAVTASYILSFFYNVYQVNSLLPGTGTKMISAVISPLAASAIMILAVYLAKVPLVQIIGEEHDLMMITSMVLVGAVSYLLPIFLMQRELILELIQLLRSVFVRKRTQFVH